MNIFNRTLLAIYSLTLFAAAVGLIAMAWNTNQKLDISVGSFNLQAFILSDVTDRWIFTAGVGLFALLGLITFFTAFRSIYPARKNAIRVRQHDGTSVDVSTSVVEALLREEIGALAHVHDVTPIVRAHKGVVLTELTVAIDPFADISTVSRDVAQATTTVLRDEIGAEQARRPVLHITYDELAARPAARPRPGGPPASQPRDTPPPPPPVPSRPGSAQAPPPPRGNSVLPPPPPPSSGGPGPLMAEASGLHSTRSRLLWDEPGSLPPAMDPPAGGPSNYPRAKREHDDHD